MDSMDPHEQQTDNTNLTYHTVLINDEVESQAESAEVTGSTANDGKDLDDCSADPSVANNTINDIIPVAAGQEASANTNEHFSSQSTLV